MSTTQVVSRRVGLEQHPKIDFKSNNEKLDICGIEFEAIIITSKLRSAYEAEYKGLRIVLEIKFEKITTAVVRLETNSYNFNTSICYKFDNKLEFKDEHEFITWFRKIKNRADEFVSLLKTNELKIGSVALKKSEETHDNPEFNLEWDGGAIYVQFDFDDFYVSTSLLVDKRSNEHSNSSNTYDVELGESLIGKFKKVCSRLRLGQKPDAKRAMVELRDAIPAFEDQYWPKTALLSTNELQQFRKDLLDVVKKYGFKVRKS